MKRAVWILVVSLAATALSVWLIGLPGICGFTGRYGDATTHSPAGVWVPICLVFIPILGIILGSFSVLGILAIRKWPPASTPNN
jgi:hypothetical protein